MASFERSSMRLMVILAVGLLFWSSVVLCRPQNNRPKDNLFFKEGKCPNTTGIIGLCMRSDYNCDSDAECDGPQKCCPYGCLRECLLPGDEVVFCPDWCDSHQDFVCANDGNSYVNPCNVQYAACTSNPRLAVVHKGLCRRART